MAKIKVSDIKPTGADLFDDSESFLSEVSNDELENAIGGLVAADARSIITAPISIVKTTIYTTTYTYTCTLPYTIVIL
ncbi:MAG: hypothetical protein KME23_02830 [Goleter apudmare HA4340-LM2]|jgi:hypothetical protein|nr:hypothetical protein [Goleter apudmare HA4340-LM2]